MYCTQVKVTIRRYCELIRKSCVRYLDLPTSRAQNFLGKNEKRKTFEKVCTLL